MCVEPRGNQGNNLAGVTFWLKRKLLFMLYGHINEETCGKLHVTSQKRWKKN